MKNHILFLIGSILFISCEKNDPTELVPPNELLRFAYDKNYKYPDGFYYEKDLSGTVYYENTISIKSIPEGEYVWIELNTTDKEEAKNWSDLSNEYSSANREIIQENQTEKYFEFIRVNIADKNDTLLSRVHHSDYFIALYDKYSKIDTVGIYNGEVNLNKIKELVEYLWSCGALNIYDKVMQSQIFNKENGFEHYIQSLDIIYGDIGLYDIIYVYDNKFIFDKKNGTLTIKRELVKKVTGNYNKV